MASNSVLLCGRTPLPLGKQPVFFFRHSSTSICLITRIQTFRDTLQGSVVYQYMFCRYFSLYLQQVANEKSLLLIISYMLIFCLFLFLFLCVCVPVFYCSVGRRTIGPLHDPVTWYGINYAGTQVPKQRNLYQSSPTFLSFTHVKVPCVPT